MAAAALTAVSMVAVTPIASRLAELPIRSIETRLVDSSIANIPINLFDDIVNVPANELHALQFFTDNLFMAGPWFVVSPTNLWGVDPGDPTHFMSVMNFLLPFPELSGMNASELDFNAGLGQQLWGLVAAELPTSVGCDAIACEPMLPIAPVTGISGLDFFAWAPEIAQRSDIQEQLFPLFANWDAVSLNQLLDGYYFNPAFDGSTDPSGSVSPFTGWGIGGTIPGTGADDAMPWSGETYTLQPWVPFENFFNSLMAAPPTDGLGGTGIDPIYFNPTEIAQIFQALAAGSMMFDPFTAGSPFCPGDCSVITSSGLDYPNLIQDIGNMMPNNPVINEWLADYAGGTANVPTADQIARAIELLQNNSFWDFQNASPPDDINPYLGDAQFFHDLWSSLGFTVPALNPDTYPVPDDIPVGAATAASSADVLSTDVSALATMLSASLPTDFLSTLQVDLAAMLAPFDTIVPADLLAQLPADLLGGL
jgi:hypothetical protein